MVALIRLGSSARGAPAERYLRGLAEKQAALLDAAARRTPWDDLATQLTNRDGRSSLRAARLALALLQVRAPGVPRLRGRLGQATDGHLAILAAQAAYPRLTAGQRATFDRFLRYTFPPATAIGSRQTGQPGGFDYEKEIVALARGLEPRLGTLGQMRIQVARQPRPWGGRHAYADAAVFGPGFSKTAEPPEVCVVTVYDDQVGPLTDLDKRKVLVHELGHCYQGYLRGVRGFWPGGTDGIKDPPWSAEGLPTWISETTFKVKTGVSFSLSWFDSEAAAMRFGYPGAGFFGLVADVVGEDELWKRVPAIMKADGTANAMIAAVTSNQKEVFDHWGAARTNDSARGRIWSRHAPSPQTEAAELDAQLIAEAPTDLVPNALEAKRYSIEFRTPLVRIEPIGDPQQVYGWLHDAASLQFKANSPPAALFCVVGTCACPRGQDGQIPDHQALRPPLTAGLAGGYAREIAGIRLTGISYDRYCGRTKRKPSSGPAVTGTWSGTLTYRPRLGTPRPATTPLRLRIVRQAPPDSAGRAVLEGELTFDLPVDPGAPKCAAAGPFQGGVLRGDRIFLRTLTHTFQGTVAGNTISGTWEAGADVACTAGPGDGEWVVRR